MDFGRDDATATTEVSGDEDRLAELKILEMALGNPLGDLDLLKSRLHSRPGVSRVGGREGDPQQEDRIAVAISVLFGIVSEDSAEEHAIQSQ
jgi:hypothetical protein